MQLHTDTKYLLFRFSDSLQFSWGVATSNPVTQEFSLTEVLSSFIKQQFTH